MTHRDEFRKRAQTLRREATKEERHLWYDFLKGYPLQFKRQTVFGNYIVDFYCPQARLVIELDGSQHYEDQGKEYDRRRTEILDRTYGLCILRFSNLEVNQNFEGVCQEIDRQVKRRVPSSDPASPGHLPPYRGKANQKGRIT